MKQWNPEDRLFKFCFASSRSMTSRGSHGVAEGIGLLSSPAAVRGQAAIGVGERGNITKIVNNIKHFKDLPSGGS
jgi:hypothetical protein